MSRPISLAIVAASLVLAASLPGRAPASAPSEEIKAHIDSIYRAAKSSQGSEQSPEARRVMKQMFDWDHMSRHALGEHWQPRSPAERAQFVELFSALFERAYLSRIHLVDAERFRYLGDSVQGEQSQVKTKVQTRSGQDLSVNYRARLAGTQWKVVDLDVDGISLLDNYRKQFDSIIRRSSYGELISRLARTVQQG